MKDRKTRKIVLLGVFVSAGIFATLARPHCQIPCGIYGDAARFDAISEHILTIKKSMKMITTLSAEAKPNMNQIVRWVENKERHADEIAHIVSYYFMAQRIKPAPESDNKAYDSYIKKLTLLHQMLVYSMKAKQTTDAGNVEKLGTLLAEFKAAYFEEGALVRRAN
jgi:nickel superoxide dismutase